jgi:LPS export ABC transporter protein LptC
MPALFSRKYTFLLVAVLFAALSIWLPEEQRSENTALSGDKKTAPDSFMENFTVSHFDKKGRLRYKLEANRLRHYDHNDYSEFSQPRFSAYRPQQQRWVVEAESGHSLNGTEKVFLNGSVTLQKQDKNNLASLQIRTHDVIIQPANDYAETAKAITIRRLGNAQHATIKAVGLQIHFREGQLRLLSQVRGLYAP